MSNVIDLDSKRNQNEIVLLAAGQFEHMAEGCIATLRTSDDDEELEKAMAVIRYFGAKLDELDAQGLVEEEDEC